MEMTPEQGYLSSQLLTKLLGDFWWGQASKKSPAWSISGRLGLKRIGPYNEMALVENGAGDLRGKERTPCT